MNYLSKAIFYPARSIHPTLSLVVNELYPHGPWLAGGAARKLFYGVEMGKSDLDVFFKDVSQVVAFKQLIKQEGATQIGATKNNSTYQLKGMNIQLIDGMFYTSQGDVLESFDYHLCQFLCDGIDIIRTLDAELNHTDGIITINKISLPLYSLARVGKYTDQGFDFHPDTLLQLARAAQKELAERGEGGSIGV